MRRVTIHHQAVRRRVPRPVRATAAVLISAAAVPIQAGNANLKKILRLKLFRHAPVEIGIKTLQKIT